MSFDQDPNEQANISGADLALMIDEIKFSDERIADLYEGLRMATIQLLKQQVEIAALKSQLATARNDALDEVNNKFLSHREYLGSDIDDEIRDLKSQPKGNVNEWVSVATSVPAVGKVVLVHYSGWRASRVAQYRIVPYPRFVSIETGRFWYSEDIYWMPLPALPTTGATS